MSGTVSITELDRADLDGTELKTEAERSGVDGKGSKDTELDRAESAECLGRANKVSEIVGFGSRGFPSFDVGVGLGRSGFGGRTGVSVKSEPTVPSEDFTAGVYDACESNTCLDAWM